MRHAVPRPALSTATRLLLAPAAVLLLLLAFVGRADAGAWGTPIDISPAGSTAESDHLGADSAGDQIAVWGQEDEGGEWSVWAATRPAHGDWAAPVRLSAAAPGSEVPSLAVNAAGEAIVAWGQNGFLGPVEVVHGNVAGDWGTPETISGEGTTGGYPQAGIDAAGQGTVIWWENLGGYNFNATTSTEEGGAWTTPHVLGSAAELPRVVVNPAGDAVAFFGSNLSYRVASRPAGGSWSAPTTLASDGSSYLNDAQLAIDDAGEAVATWFNREGGTPRIETSWMSPDGTWTAAETVPTAHSEEWGFSPSVAMTAGGEAIAVWVTVSNGENLIESSTRTKLSGWTTPVQVPVTEMPTAWEPLIEIAPSGIATVVHSGWSAADHYTIGVIQRAADGTWGSESLLSETEEEAYGQVFDVDATGGVTVAWLDWSEGEVLVRSVNLPGALPSSDTGAADIDKAAPSPTLVVCTAPAGVVAAKGYVPATIKPGKTVPGVRARISVPTPSKVGVEATFTYKGHAVSGGDYSMSMAKTGNLRVPVPGSLRAKLPFGSKVPVSLRIVSTPKGSSPCAAPVTTTRKLTLKVVRVLSGAR